MISLDGTFEIDSTQTEQLIVSINSHPFKAGQLVNFSSTHSQLKHWGVIMLLL